MAVHDPMRHPVQVCNWHLRVGISASNYSVQFWSTYSKREDCILCGRHELNVVNAFPASFFTSLAVMNIFHGMRVPMPCNTRVR